MNKTDRTHDEHEGLDGHHLNKTNHTHDEHDEHGLNHKNRTHRLQDESEEHARPLVNRMQNVHFPHHQNGTHNVSGLHQLHILNKTKNFTRPHFDNEPKPSNKRNLRKLDVRSSKFVDLRKSIYTCVEETPNISANLKKFLDEHKENDLKEFFKAMKESLTDEEKNVVRNCRRQAFKSRFQLKH